MEQILNRWSGKEIFGTVARHDHGKPIVLFDASELMQHFVSMSLAQIHRMLDAHLQARMDKFNNQDRLITVPAFLCYVLPYFGYYTNLHPSEWKTLQNYTMEVQPHLQKTKLERTWYDNDQDRNDTTGFSDAVKSLFEAGVLPRTPLLLEESILDVHTAIPYPPLYYKPNVLKDHFQESQPFNKLVSLVLLQDYLQHINLPLNTSEKRKAFLAKEPRCYLKPGDWDDHFHLEEVLSDTDDYLGIFDRLHHRNGSNELMPFTYYLSDIQN